MIRAWRAVLRQACLAALVVRAAAGAEIGAPGLPLDLGTIVVSARAGYSYAYAPALLREGPGYRMLYCSTGDGGAWDWIRSTTSLDGRIWSAPVTLLQPAPGERERATCDPSLVRYQGPGDAEPFYYLFYSGSPNGVGASIFVARASGIEGPYAKWTGADWRVGGVPVPVIGPVVAHADGSGFYGAGQPSVVVRGNRLRVWYTDDTGCTPGCPRILTSEGASPISWNPAVATDVAATSVEVKYDPRAARYAMWAISAPYTFSAYLVGWHSEDGVRWGRPEIVVGPTGFVHYAHNLGVAGDTSGQILPGDVLMAFGAPSRGDCGACWARWDLRGWMSRERQR